MSNLVQRIESIVCDNGKTVYHIGALPTKNGLEAGDVKVKEIGQHEPRGPGDLWFYDVMFEDGSVVRVFNMEQVYFSKPKAALAVPQKQIII